MLVKLLLHFFGLLLEIATWLAASLSLSGKKTFLYLLFLILFLNSHTLTVQGDFVVIIAYMCTVYLEQVHGLHYISIPFVPPPHFLK
jgi:hypothetical protein